MYAMQHDDLVHFNVSSLREKVQYIFIKYIRLTLLNFHIDNLRYLYHVEYQLGRPSYRMYQQHENKSK